MKKKICLILAFVVLLLFTVGSQCFASQEQLAFFYEGAYRFIPTEFTDKYTYFAMFKYNNIYYLYCSNKSFYYIDSDKPVLGDNGEFLDLYTYSSLDNLNNYDSFFHAGTHNPWFCNYPGTYLHSYDADFIASNFDFTDENGNAVQFANSGSGTFSYSSSLPEIYQSIGLNKVLDEIVDLLPVCLSAMISFIAVRKGLAFLQNILRKS